MTRNHQLDFFRGALLVLITVNHALTNDNVIRRFTYEFIGHVTAASGFVFLSGLTAGLVYSRKYSEKGGLFIATAATRRAGLIYRNHLLLMLFAFALVVSFPALKGSWSASYAYFAQEPVLSLAMGSVLLHQPQYLDILPMYTLFMLGVPALVRWCQRGHVGRVLLGSVALYSLSLLHEPYSLLSVLPLGPGVTIGFFNLLNWQLLFVSGVALGFLSFRGKTASWQRNRPLFVAAALVSTVLFALKNLHLDISGLNMDRLVNKANMGPTRLLNFAAVCFVLTFVATRRPHWFTFRPLNYLGRYSLEVFTFQVVLTVLFLPAQHYLSQISKFKAVNDFHFYPLETLVVFFVIVPAMFLAPALLNRHARLRLKAKLQLVPVALPVVPADKRDNILR